ncbi:uncharacterized protein LOC126249137 [Schistocerca nitens]|uniref:uncharacterized protein LOC126249137 n=1 Tax=Schistocerca nitens TaxID=7011 RepID=UPI002119645A|nr:uncharacterized protein LOC126249137 [Schistocerca nitens]
MNGGGVPSEWKTCNIRLKQKKRYHNNPNNYSALGVIAFFGRLYMKVLNKLAEKETCHKWQEKQAGFQAGRSVMDNIFTLKLISEKCTKFGLEMGFAFIDPEKAYDEVPPTNHGKS